MKAWDLYDHAFKSANIDVSSLPSEVQQVISPWNEDLATYLEGLSNMQMRHLHKREALVLLSLFSQVPQVQRVASIFNSLENAAQEIADINNGKSVSNYHLSKLKAAI